MKKKVTCCLCGGECEEWLGSRGYGHNPWPLAEFGRCCDLCNGLKVLPSRIRMMYLGPVVRRKTVPRAID
jgi:hypothetical protein